MADAPIFVISGQLAAGKTSVAAALLARYPRGYHVDVDGIREGVASGLAGPLDWTPETDRQFALAIAASAALAATYQRAGFAVAIEGALDPAQIDAALTSAGVGRHRVGVVLHPALDIARERNRQRATKAFDTSILDDVMRSIDADLAADPAPPGWTTIDNGAESLEATVERVLALAGTGTGAGATVAAGHIVALDDLEHTEHAHELVGAEHGGLPFSVILVHSQPGVGPKLHRHPYAEVFIVEDGQATFRIGDATVVVEAGHVVVSPPGEAHGFINTGTGELRLVAIHGAGRFDTEWLVGPDPAWTSRSAGVAGDQLPEVGR